MVRDDLLSRPMQIPRPAIIAQSFPEPQDLAFLGRGQVRHGGKRLQKSLEVRNDRRHLRLLEHDFADPDRVRIPTATPRKVSAATVEPGKEQAVELRMRDWGFWDFDRRAHRLPFFDPRSKIRNQIAVQVRGRRMYFSRIALAAEEVLPEAVLAARSRSAPPPAADSAGGVGLGGVMMSITVLPVGTPSLSTLVLVAVPAGSSCTERIIAAAASSSADPAEAVGGIGVGWLMAGLASRTTRNSNGPTDSWSWSNSSCSPLTGWSLTRVPLVLSKSRTKTRLPRVSKAQCRLLMSALAGRRLHCGSRPIRNCAIVMGIDRSEE